ncbi:hypothetical protein [Acetobacter oryzoeni]|uniref:hypothetical protein n=1 Tax=Acetobacter oryzoeni TaxID=2500548 RepID=UPI003DA977D8
MTASGLCGMVGFMGISHAATPEVTFFRKSGVQAPALLPVPISFTIFSPKTERNEFVEDDFKESFLKFRDFISKNINETNQLLVTEMSRLNGENIVLKSIVLDIINNSQENIPFLLRMQLQQQLELGPDNFNIPKIFQEHWIAAIKHWLSLIPKDAPKEPDPLDALAEPINSSINNEYIEDLLTDARKFAEYANRDTRRLTSAMESHRVILAKLLMRLNTADRSAILNETKEYASNPPVPADPQNPNALRAGSRLDGLELRAFNKELDAINSLLKS